jgi:hypothetical protein
MRRRLLLLAAVVVPSVTALAVAAHGCGTEPPFESACLWLEDPNNCYREFREDMKATANPTSPDNPSGDCKPGGNPTQATSGSAGKENGTFSMRSMLATCVLDQGGSVTIDPAVDLTQWPPNPYAAPVTYTITLQTADGNTCGVATYTSPHGFSITINPLPDGGIGTGGGTTGGTGGGATTGTTPTGDAGRIPDPYGTFTSVIAPGRDAFDVTCPSGETHHFNLDEIAGLPGEDGGSCPHFSEFLPSASFQVYPGGTNQPGAISFAITYPPIPKADAGVDTYPDASTAELPPITDNPVVYFNCTIPGAAEQCVDGVKDGAETDVDCGGPQNPSTTVCGQCPARCAAMQQCLCDDDCEEGLKCYVVAQGMKQCGSPAPDAGAHFAHCGWATDAGLPCTPSPGTGDGGTGGGGTGGAGTGGSPADAGPTDSGTD